MPVVNQRKGITCKGMMPEEVLWVFRARTCSSDRVRKGFSPDPVWSQIQDEAWKASVIFLTLQNFYYGELIRPKEWIKKLAKD